MAFSKIAWNDVYTICLDALLEKVSTIKLLMFLLLFLIILPIPFNESFYAFIYACIRFKVEISY